MTFDYQLNNLFNQRRAGLSEEELVNLDQRHRKLRRRHNRLQEFGQNNNIAFEVTVTDGYEIPVGLSFPFDVVLASGQFHIAINNIFEARRDGHLANRDPVDLHEIQYRGHKLHNGLVLRGDGGDGVSITVVASDMNNDEDNMPLPIVDDNMNEEEALRRVVEDEAAAAAAFEASWRAELAAAAAPLPIDEGELPARNFPLHWQPAEPLPIDEVGPLEADNAARHIAADNMPLHWQPAEPLLPPLDLDALLQLVVHGWPDEARAERGLP